MSVIETERLILREFVLEDAPFIFELLNSPGWLKYIGPRGVTGLKEAGKYITVMMMPGYEKYGFGFYMMVRKNDGAEMGMCGLIKRDSLEDVDIGFAILPEYEGNGYTSEAAAATLVYARDTLNLKRIAGITVSYNKGSIKLMEKLEMKFEKMIRLPNDEEELMLYVREF